MNLYEKLDIAKYNDVLDKNDKSFMSYCPECGMETTFIRSEHYERVRNNISIKLSSHIPGKVKVTDIKKDIKSIFDSGHNNYNLYIQEYKCCVDKSHYQYNIYYISGDKMIKIGQYPSEVDKGSNEYLDKIKSICKKNEAKEIVNYIKTALIMESGGYGIASLLYIRRAFEHLINISEGKDKNDNTGGTMKERIKNNKYLPDVIKSKSKVYNVISEGIHNQTEAECMELFKVIKVGVIILIRKTYDHVEEKKILEELGVTLNSL